MPLSIYIAGPMRGHPYYNFPAFDMARNRLIEMGWVVLSPADMDRADGNDPAKLPGNTDWSKAAGVNLGHAILRDLKILQECDAIALLHGWQSSKGARAEAAVAEFMDKIRIDPSTGEKINGWSRNENCKCPVEVPCACWPVPVQHDAPDAVCGPDQLHVEKEAAP